MLTYKECRVSAPVRMGVYLLAVFQLTSAWLPHSMQRGLSPVSKRHFEALRDPNTEEMSHRPTCIAKHPKDLYHDTAQAIQGFALSLLLVFSPISGLLVDSQTAKADVGPSVTTSKSYDGFADYAKENKMQQSDVGCFIKMCGEQTKALFSNPRGIKGVSCLGRCKGEQSCATRCFAEFGSEDLNNWLSCTIEENECVKVPKNVDNSAEDLGYASVVNAFDPNTLIGTWYKTDGLNPNYDLFDCQTNTFKPSIAADNELDMDIFFRVSRPGGGFWENALTEHMVLDTTSSGTTSAQTQSSSSRRTMHTQGKMYGLQFSENWFIIGESDGRGDIPPFKLVAYRGHTLQGNYDGAFVYAKEPILPAKAIPAVREAAAKAGLNFDQFTRIDNTCPTNERALNDASAGTGTSTTDWINLVVGEGGVIDWISPGWRGEYKNIN